MSVLANVVNPTCFTTMLYSKLLKVNQKNLNLTLFPDKYNKCAWKYNLIISDEKCLIFASIILGKILFHTIPVPYSPDTWQY